MRSTSTKINLALRRRNDNRHGHHARTVDGEHIAIGKAIAIGSAQPNIDRTPQLRHAHKCAGIGLVPIE